MNVNIVVDEKVWRTFRGECVKRGLKASQILEDHMKDWLKKWGVAVEGQPKRKTKK